MKEPRVAFSWTSVVPVLTLVWDACGLSLPDHGAPPSLGCGCEWLSSWLRWEKSGHMGHVPRTHTCLPAAWRHVCSSAVCFSAARCPKNAFYEQPASASALESVAHPPGLINGMQLFYLTGVIYSFRHVEHLTPNLGLFLQLSNLNSCFSFDAPCLQSWAAHWYPRRADLCVSMAAECTRSRVGRPWQPTSPPLRALEQGHPRPQGPHYAFSCCVSCQLCGVLLEGLLLLFLTSSWNRT